MSESGAATIDAIVPGMSFGRLKVIEGPVDFSVDGRKRFRCACVCGHEHVASGKDLRRGGVRSCGCLARETARATVRVASAAMAARREARRRAAFERRVAERSARRAAAREGRRAA